MWALLLPSIFVRRNVLVWMNQTGHHIVPLLMRNMNGSSVVTENMSDTGEISTSTSPEWRKMASAIFENSDDMLVWRPRCCITTDGRAPCYSCSYRQLPVSLDACRGVTVELKLIMWCLRLWQTRNTIHRIVVLIVILDYVGVLYFKKFSVR